MIDGQFTLIVSAWPAIRRFTVQVIAGSWKMRCNKNRTAVHRNASACGEMCNVSSLHDLVGRKKCNVLVLVLALALALSLVFIPVLVLRHVLSVA